MTTGLFWIDGDGLVHILLGGSFVMACTGHYRPPPDRVIIAVPTCLWCIADSFDRFDSGLIRKDGEPGIIKW